MAVFAIQNSLTKGMDLQCGIKHRQIFNKVCYTIDRLPTIILSSTARYGVKH